MQNTRFGIIRKAYVSNCKFGDVIGVSEFSWLPSLYMIRVTVWSYFAIVPYSVLAKNKSLPILKEQAPPTHPKAGIFGHL